MSNSYVQRIQRESCKVGIKKIAKFKETIKCHNPIIRCKIAVTEKQDEISGNSCPEQSFLMCTVKWEFCFEGFDSALYLDIWIRMEMMPTNGQLPWFYKRFGNYYFASEFFFLQFQLSFNNKFLVNSFVRNQDQL